MQAASMHAAPEDVRAFVQEYFGAWKGTDENKILAYYSDDIVLQLPTGTLSATTLSVPLSPASPATSMQYATRRTRNLAAVEWSFEAVHSGPFANLAPTKKVQLPGCSFYEYDLAKRIIPAGRIYFDLATLMKQITG
jgi:hypothetical protein